MPKKLLASSDSLPGIANMISRYFYGSTIELKLNLDTQQWDVYNKNGKVNGFFVIVDRKQPRHKFYQE